MIKFIIGAIIFGLIALAIIILVIINFTYKGVRKLKEEVEESYYRNQKIKEQKERNPFGEDYFKSASTPKKPKTKSDKNDKSDKQQQQQQQRQQQQSEKEKTAQSNPEGSRVTIIDDRDVEDKRKIFDNSDGEYVEFEEVHD